MVIEIDIEDVLSGRIDWIDDNLTKKLAKPSLKCIEKEFPHYVQYLDSVDSFITPKEEHPLFYGCYDWHSSVHSHWNLVRQMRLFHDHPLEDEILEVLDRHFTKEKVSGEVEFFEDNRKFEKPYGWGWFLRLMSELYLMYQDKAENWEEILHPLEEKIIELIEDEFLRQERPFRVGIHANSAFSLINILDYTRIKSDSNLEFKVMEKSKEFFLKDKSAPVEYEPTGWDFLSPILTEADLMRRVLDENEYVRWFEDFLPDLSKPDHTQFLEPIKVELDELMKYHLIGLNLSKAWCMNGIAAIIPVDHQYKNILKDSAEKHAKEGLKQAFSEDYGGSHWLLSFALYLFTINEGGIDP
ncbi:MAG: DUF2891 domain-containing protein [Thermoplasmatota archaeon]